MQHKWMVLFTKLVILIVVLSMLFSGDALSSVSAQTGVTWYVSLTGNDSNSCSTASNPCATINGAIGKAAAGDLIKIAIGTYTGTGTEVVAIDENITLSGGWDAGFIQQVGYSTIDGETSRQGILINVRDVALTRFIIQNSVGSGIYIPYWGGATVNKSTITDNLNANGGGIFNEGLLVLNNSSVHNNIAENFGGGIYNLGSAMISNTTISHNSAYWGGGVLVSGSETDTTLNNVTLSNNTASSQGGGISSSLGNFILKNTIIANNAAVMGLDCTGSVTSSGYNIVENTESCIIASTIGDQFNIDPQLGELSPSLGVHPLSETSPAIDAGNPVDPGSQEDACLLTDQREVERPLDGPDSDLNARCDIGAYEYAAPENIANLLYFNGSPQLVTPGTQLPFPMKVVAVDSRGTPIPGVAVRFSAPVDGASGTFSGSNTNISTVFTDLNGVATAPIFTANTIIGSYNIVAANADILNAVKFSVTNGYWVVATSGNNSNDCMSVALPCATIQGVLNKPGFSHGQRIRIGTGIYGTTENALVSKNLTISGGWNPTFTTQIGTSVIEDTISIPLNVVVTLEHLTIRNNVVTAGVSNQGTLTVRNSSIIDNNRGIDNFGDLTVINSTISGNGLNGSMPSYGGGISNQTFGYVTNPKSKIINSTITNNTAHSGGGIYNDSTAAGVVILQNSIIAGNTASTGYGSDCQGGNGNGTFTSLGYNIIGNIGLYNGVVYPCKGNWLGTDMVGNQNDPIDSEIETLTNLGNDVWVHPLKLSSPAVDGVLSNTCPSTDQRGMTRPQGTHCDIGAYETQYLMISGNAGAAGVTLSYVNGTPQTVTSAADGSYTISVPVGWSGTVTPSKTGFTFTPVNRSYSNLQSDQTGQNYTAQATTGSADTTGVFRPINGILFLKNSHSTGFADVALNYGIPGDYPVVGDWDGDGDATIGVYRNGSFYLRNANTVGFADVVFAFGQPGDQPIAGDWDGNGSTTIGVFRPSTGLFMLRNANTAGSADTSFFLGNVGDVGIAGDWNNDGIDTTGVFRPSNGIIFLKNTNTTGFADIALNYGIPGDKPVVGDWDGDGDDTIGIYRNGTFYLRNSNTIGFADIVFGLGNSGDHPIAGNWDGLP